MAGLATTLKELVIDGNVDTSSKKTAPKAGGMPKAQKPAAQNSALPNIPNVPNISNNMPNVIGTGYADQYQGGAAQNMGR